MMFCTQCGKQVPDASKFCPACGANLQDGGAPAQTPTGGSALKLAIAGGVIAVMGAAGYFMLSAAPAPEPTPPPKPAIEAKAPEPQAPDKPADATPALAEPKPPASDAAEIAAAHKALDQ